MTNNDEGYQDRFGLLSENGGIVPLKAIKVDVQIFGYVAEVTSTLTYINTEETPVEAVFTFPVDDGSAVFQFEAHIDGHHITAEIQEREQAKLTYQDAIERGKTALLLKEDTSAGDIFSCMLGNLPAQSEATLVMKYVTQLPQETDGQFRFTLPTVLNPRYSSDVGSTVSAEGATYVPPSKIPYEFRMTATVKGYHRVNSVMSYKDKLNVQLEENGKIAKVNLCEEFKFDHDLSFLVQYDCPYSPQVVLEKGNPEAESLLKEDMLMISFHPDLKEVSMATNGEYIFVIDRSGSMQGDKIQSAREALLLFLMSLPADCYFNIVSFGSFFNSLFPTESKKYSSESLDEAFTLQKTMEADMYGTEIQKPLTHVFNMDPIEGHPRRVFVLTDGEVDDIRCVTQLVKTHTHNSDTRVFALGIGDGASTALVKGIANNGGGKSELVVEEERLHSKVISLLKYAMQPAITDVRINWDLPAGLTPITIPSEPPVNIYAGERLTLFTILRGYCANHNNVSGSVTLNGQQSGNPVSYKMTFTLQNTNDLSTSAPIHRLATKAQIKLLQDTVNADVSILNPIEVEELCVRIFSLSCLGNVVSRYTAFVAIDTKGKKVIGDKKTRKCPVPMNTVEYRDGMYDAKLMKEGVTDQSLYSAAIRKTCVQRMKLTKKHQRMLDEDEEKWVKDGSGSRFDRHSRRRAKLSCCKIKLPKFSQLFSNRRQRKDNVRPERHQQAGAASDEDYAQISSSMLKMDISDNNAQTRNLPSGL
ncbi:von Willebrand factor A domain-containing protein 5A-like isoform X2 [Ruditapes philippinarum]|uniref:von Willebrand factor A domain-containing protein 5A-like isoform X2 n=1 Tax=Ruditapes philippinarum TaxID=129788 RepID=UPI00295B2097|nr:von Willebrand factor A domain-containing protein 5A-like isoform X2 [Ruditapes philippinarum]